MKHSRNARSGIPELETENSGIPTIENGGRQALGSQHLSTHQIAIEIFYDRILMKWEQISGFFQQSSFFKNFQSMHPFLILGKCGDELEVELNSDRSCILGPILFDFFPLFILISFPHFIPDILS